MLDQGVVKLAITTKATALFFPLSMLVAAWGGIWIWDRYDQKRWMQLRNKKNSLERIERKLNELLAQRNNAPPNNYIEQPILGPTQNLTTKSVSSFSKQPRIKTAKSTFSDKSDLLKKIIQENINLRQELQGSVPDL